MMKLRNSLKEIRFVEDFEKDGKRLYDLLFELSKDNENVYYDLVEDVVNTEGKLIHNWLSQLQINKMMKRNHIEYDLTVMLYDKDGNLVNKINIIY